MNKLYTFFSFFLLVLVGLLVCHPAVAAEEMCRVKRGEVVVPVPCAPNSSAEEPTPLPPVLPEVVRGAIIDAQPAAAGFDILRFVFELVGGMPNFADRVQIKAGYAYFRRTSLLAGSFGGKEPTGPFEQGRDPELKGGGVTILLLGDPNVMLGRSLSLGFEAGVGGDGVVHGDRVDHPFYGVARASLSEGLTLAYGGPVGFQVSIGGDYWYVGSQEPKYLMGAPGPSEREVDSRKDRPTLVGPGWYTELLFTFGGGNKKESDHFGLAVQAGEIWAERLFSPNPYSLGRSTYHPGKMVFGQIAIEWILN